MSAPTQDLIDRLGAAALDARAAIREAHEARRDLRVALAEAKAELARDANEQVEAAVAAGVKAILDRTDTERFGRGLKKALEQWLELLAEAQDVANALERYARRVGARPRIENGAPE